MPTALRSPLIQRCALTVRRLREARGFSQENFAREIGLHRTFMGVLERGQTNPSLTTLALVAHGLGLTLTELMREIEHTRLPSRGRKLARGAR